jgi:hypothetical protein
MSNSNSSIQDIVHSIDIEKYNSIESEREKVMADVEFQKWCSELRIGSRVELKDYRATELMQQYTNYPKWVSRMF